MTDMYMGGIQMKRINCEGNLDDWHRSPAFNSLQIFLDKLFSSIKGLKLSEIPRRTTKNDDKLWELLEKIEKAVEEVEPEEMKGQRYGNKAFRILIERIERIAQEEFDNFYLRQLILVSFGDPTRIDYGTGHELAFIIFVMSFYNHINKNDEIRVNYGEIGGWLIGTKYLNLVRRIQGRYYLEPAGSHGVWGLDDHQFIPFLLGSAQLIGKEEDSEFGKGVLIPSEIIKPVNFSKEDLSREYLYPAALNHIHHLKTRSNSSLQFHHHSPLLYDISGVTSWQKIHEGLRRMYVKEVLSKVPVIQHLLFDDELFIYK
jgi:serine/threonine-protein phosphatase 2A activator